jgi:hypothetical protein
MSIDSIQGILSRLYTDADFLREFIADKNIFYKTHGIVSQETIEFLEAVPVEQIVLFARSLTKKRIHEIKNLIPATTILIGKRINELLLEHSEAYVPNGIHKHHDDAATFINFLLKQKELPDVNPIEGFIRSVLVYELQKIQSFISPKKILISFYRYDILKNYSLILKFSDFKLPQKKITIIIWKDRKSIKVF